MRPRYLALLALVCAWSQQAYAGERYTERCSSPADDTPAAEGGVCIPPPPASSAEFAELPAARGKGQYAVMIRQIANYASVGNQAAVEILTAQLIGRGVSRETISEGVTWAKVHVSPQDHQHYGAPSTPQPDLEAGSEMSH